jgi:hypothetical protein
MRAGCAAEGIAADAAPVSNRKNPEAPMRKLIVWIAGAVTLISVAAARPALLGEISLAAPTLTDLHQPADPDHGAGHSLRHAHMPLFAS